MNSNKPYGVLLGIAFIVFGAVLGGVNFLAITYGEWYFPKLFVAAGTFAMMGLSMMLRPGAVVPPGTPDDRKVKAWWSASTIMDRVIWVLAGAIGLAISFYMMLKVDPGFADV